MRRQILDTALSGVVFKVLESICLKAVAGGTSVIVSVAGNLQLIPATDVERPPLKSACIEKMEVRSNVDLAFWLCRDRALAGIDFVAGHVPVEQISNGFSIMRRQCAIQNNPRSPVIYRPAGAVCAGGVAGVQLQIQIGQAPIFSFQAFIDPFQYGWFLIGEFVSVVALAEE